MKTRRVLGWVVTFRETGKPVVVARYAMTRAGAVYQAFRELNLVEAGTTYADAMKKWPRLRSQLKMELRKVYAIHQPEKIFS